MGREPTEEEVSKYIKKMAKKAAKADAGDEEAPKKKKGKKREAEADDDDESAKKKAKKEKKAKKAAAAAEEDASGAADEGGAAVEAEEATEAAPSGDANLAENPDRMPKVFVGNLSYDVNDSSDPEANTDIKGLFGDCGTITDIFFLTDKETGRFYGTGFVTFDSAEAADKAIAKNGQDLLGRPVKVMAAKPKPGGGGSNFKSPGGAGKREARPMSEMEDGCVTMFMGNLSFDIDETTNGDNKDLGPFFKDCGDIKNIRWLTDRETQEFKGCGFIEFYDTDAVVKAAKLNGEMVKGRAIRLDFAKARAPKAW